MSAASTPDARFAGLARAVSDSYAHNSALYGRLASASGLEDIFAFLRWDARQPAFNVFLRHWLSACPAPVRGELLAHIAEEEEQGHSALFATMMADLARRLGDPPEPAVDEEVLARLNYTFSAECARERPFGFFLGGFFATEVMSAKRCSQLLDGLRRCGVRPDPDYLTLHVRVDQNHAARVLDLMVAPYLASGGDFEPVRAGARDRLERSEAYLRYYERRQLR